MSKPTADGDQRIHLGVVTAGPEPPRMWHAFQKTENLISLTQCKVTKSHCGQEPNLSLGVCPSLHL